MNKPNVASFSFSSASSSLFSIALVLGLAACGSASSEPSAASGQAVSTPDLIACTVDDDCVSVSRGGCCPNGWLTAVNVDHVDAYAAEHVCKEQVICPHYVVNDKRRASCNADAKQCEMITRRTTALAMAKARRDE